MSLSASPPILIPVDDGGSKEERGLGELVPDWLKESFKPIKVFHGRDQYPIPHWYCVK